MTTAVLACDYFTAKTHRGARPRHATTSELAQWWVGGYGPPLIRTLTRSDVNHAGAVADDRAVTVEANWHGTDKRHARGYIFRPPLDPRQRADLPAVLYDLLGTGYNLPGLAALEAQQVGFGWLPGVKGRLEDERDLFCSQLVDLAYARVGFHLFDDGRPHGDVTPGDLHTLGMQSGWYVGYIGAPDLAR